MSNSNNTYIGIIFLHVLIGVGVFIFPFLSQILSILLFFVFLFFIIKNKNISNEALLFSAYIVTSEVFFRMTKGAPNNEFGKYSVLIFLAVGILYSGFSKKSYVYWMFILLLIPGVFIGVYSLAFETNIRKAIAFNISGPVCLAVSAIYCFQRKVDYEFFEKLISIMIFPLISILVYMFLYTPTNREIFSNTSSNFETSGGFGPNQVSTILGFGMFLFFSKLLLYSKLKIAYLINLALLFYISYRCIITFSRGGFYTGIAMILLLLFSIYLLSNTKGKFKINFVLIITIFLGISIFTYSSYQTGGMIDKRYAGKDALGRQKDSNLSGREELVETELKMFLDNPITGIGVGVNKQYRQELTGITSASHNEISRMLAEHGLLGIICLLILIFTPLTLYFKNKTNFYLLSFYVFWLLTINHAAMRLAAPGFIYALSLLNVSINEKPTLHRK